jgi:hypothetical protein
VSAADELFQALGLESVDRRLDWIAATAAALLKGRKAGMYKSQLADINRWAIRHLDLCARTFERPPPVELVLLIEFQLGADKPKRDGTKKNRQKFIAAAHYVAEHPNATPAQIARRIKYDQKYIIAGWLNDQEFREIVGARQFRLAHQQKKGTLKPFATPVQGQSMRRLAMTTTLRETSQCQTQRTWRFLFRG